MEQEQERVRVHDEHRVRIQQMEITEQQRKEHLAKTFVLRRIQQATVRKAYERWRLSTLQKRRIEAILHRTALKLKLMTVAKAYRKWLVMYKNTIRRRRLINRFNKRTIGQAFEIWYEASVYSSEQEHILCLRSEVFERHWRTTVLLQRVLHAWSNFIKQIKKSQYIVRGVIHQSLRTPRSTCCTEFLHKLRDHGVYPRRTFSLQLKEHCGRCLLRHVFSTWLGFVDWCVDEKLREWEERDRLRQEQEERAAAQQAEEDRLQQEQEDREAAQRARAEEEERLSENVFFRLVKKSRQKKRSAVGILHELGCDQDSDYDSNDEDSSDDDG